MVVIGIDPGLSGAVAGLVDGKLVYAEPVATEGKGKHRDFRLQELVTTIEFLETRGATCVCFIEKAPILPPGFSKQASTKLARAEGIWLGILAALMIRFEVVPAKTWKATMMSPLSAAARKDKVASVLVAGNLFPKTMGGNRDHNVADAVLIAEYGRRRIGGQG